jgi:hypothetical protein
MSGSLINYLFWGTLEGGLVGGLGEDTFAELLACIGELLTLPLPVGFAAT